MNVEIGTEAVQLPEKEYINGTFVAVQNRHQQSHISWASPFRSPRKVWFDKKRGKFVTVGSEKKKKETIGERRRWEGGEGMLSNIRREKERKENRPCKNSWLSDKWWIISFHWSSLSKSYQMIGSSYYHFLHTFEAKIVWKGWKERKTSVINVV
jgi:hypothetical protein